jgi:hypothetical protein
VGAAIWLALLLAAPALADERGEIRVRVVDLRSSQGELRLGLYDKKATFATKDGPIRVDCRRNQRAWRLALLRGDDGPRSAFRESAPVHQARGRRRLESGPARGRGPRNVAGIAQVPLSLSRADRMGKSR